MCSFGSGSSLRSKGMKGASRGIICDESEDIDDDGFKMRSAQPQPGPTSILLPCTPLPLLALSYFLFLFPPVCLFHVKRDNNSLGPEKGSLRLPSNGVEKKGNRGMRRREKG